MIPPLLSPTETTPINVGSGLPIPLQNKGPPESPYWTKKFYLKNFFLNITSQYKKLLNIIFIWAGLFGRKAIGQKFGRIKWGDRSKFFSIFLKWGNRSKHRSNDFNVVRTTCNDRQYWRDVWAKVYERSEHRATPGREAGVVSTNRLFQFLTEFLTDCLSTDGIFSIERWQIEFWPINFRPIDPPPIYSCSQD